ncbi:MAG: adenylyltransferase/cytidyltransferase family protein [Candidatus Gracilibacteria bacterium]|nr:adenylyltransferase/cytidyltransferase family protein [Candidatus Gracilibacteria bacterium]
MIIREIDELNELVKKLRKDDKKIIWTNGCFDIIHPGHIKTFEDAKNLGDVLIIGINGDLSPYWKTKEGRPINDEFFRSTVIDSIKYVDIVYIFNDETPIIPIINILPDVLVKGGDYQIEKIVGFEEVIKNGGKVITIPIYSNYSTTGIIEKILNLNK